ncbi:MAG TPA: hypothetical protein VJT83_00885, partial [Chitinophagaceae bacterium]|nr:hypothetical protein [Chitinophagaceae bacterium]
MRTVAGPLLILMLAANFAFGQNPISDTSVASCISSAHRQLDECLSIMQKYYYRKDSVEWDTLIKAAKNRVENSSNCNEANQTVKWCFQQMKEQHSFIMPAVKAKIYNGNINSNNEPPSLEKLAGPMLHEQIEKDIAYLSVPWLASADDKICNAYADS